MPPKKDTPHPRAKEKPQKDGRRGKIVFTLKLHTRQRCLDGSNKNLCAQGLLESPECLWQVWGLILNGFCPSYHLSGASPLPLDMGYLLIAVPVPCRCSSNAYHLSGAPLSLDMGYLLTATPALCSCHSSVLAWRIPGTGEPGGLPSMGSHRVGHD